VKKWGFALAQSKVIEKLADFMNFIAAIFSYIQQFIRLHPTD
jgi:hypothetical protein